MLMALSATYTQESSSNKNPDETLDVTMEFVPGGGYYFILKSKQWSVNDVDEIKGIFDSLKKFADENYHLGK